MIDTPDRTRANGTHHETVRPNRDELVALLAQEVRSPLTAIWNAVHMLSYARDDATVERVRQLVTRQVKHLSHVVDELEVVFTLLRQGEEIVEHLSRVTDGLAEALRATDGGPNTRTAAVGLVRADTPIA